MDLRPAVVALLGMTACSGACSGKSNAPKTAIEDARANAAGDAAVAGDTASEPGGPGDVRVHVHWKDVPAGARGAPGRTACGTARPPQVAPTVLWGIPEVFVQIAVKDAASDSGAATARRITLAECTLAPRVAVAGSTVTLTSAMQAPVQVVVQRTGELPLPGVDAQPAPREVYLPIAGHEVEIALEPGSIYRIAAGDETIWVVATGSPFVAISDASGGALVHDVPAGAHAVIAWLPARSGQPARVARGKVTVTAGAIAEVTLDLTTP